MHFLSDLHLVVPRQPSWGASASLHHPSHTGLDEDSARQVRARGGGQRTHSTLHSWGMFVFLTGRGP